MAVLEAVRAWDEDGRLVGRAKGNLFGETTAWRNAGYPMPETEKAHSAKVLDRLMDFLEEPEGKPMTPTQAIAATLARAGVTKQKDQAAILGELPQHWNRYVKGHRSPQCAKVQGWMRRLALGGYAVELRWTGDGVQS